MPSKTHLKPKPSSSVFSSLNFLFYTSKLFGLIPYSLSDFISKVKFEISPFGNVYCILSCIFYAILYHIMMADSMIVFKDQSTRVTSLTEVIGVIIIYLEPFMMIVDIIASIINQAGLIDVFERLQMIDEKLASENIFLNYKSIRKFSIILILIAVIMEIGLSTLNMMIFLEVLTVLRAILWICSCFPLLINCIAKIWFLSLILLIQQRLRGINEHLSDMAETFGDKKVKFGRNELFLQTVEFLRNEIAGGRENKDKKKGWKVGDVKTISGVRIVEPYEPKKDPSLINDRLDPKLINLCRMHDELCEIAKKVNRMFSFQMLITMAYSFMFITAQCYFMYCGLLGQYVPELFRTASNYGAIAGIVYVAYKCVIIIYISWKTKIDSQRTAVQLHKIANVVDENHFYIVCNHLSLKLLNHHLNFTACGFFDLDMETIYAITGAITSYLIILIQFNLAGKKTDENVESSTVVGNFSLTTTLKP